ncbi:hypothetical protein HGM15179_021545, partial [Zosterops borbonicus]
MGRGAASGAVLGALVVLGAAPAAGAELSGVFQNMGTSECYFINGTEKMKLVKRLIYNREVYLIFDSDVGHYVGYTPRGEKCAQHFNSDPDYMEKRRTQVRWFEGQQELSGQVVATDVVPNGDWSHQLLVLLERPPRRGLSYTCQVEHVSLEQPLRRHWVSEPSPEIPQFMIVGFVDGIPFVRYDSERGWAEPLTQWMKDGAEPGYWDSQTQKAERWQHRNARKLEILQDRSVRGAFQHGYDGWDFISLDLGSGRFVAADGAAEMTRRRWEQDGTVAERWTNNVKHICPEWLQKYVRYGQKELERK